MPNEPEKHNIMEAVNAPHQFSYENGIVITRVEPGLAEGVLHVGPNSYNPHGRVHGGALVTLADTVGGSCACSNGGSCVTSGCSMEFLRPAGGSAIYCKATPKKLGRSLSVIAVELSDDEGKVVATGTYTFFMFSGEN
jgi:acyl-CoA thioesterase